MAEFTLKPIGILQGSHRSKSSLPRQGHLSSQKGYIEFSKGFDAKSALRGLEKMSHVWVIFSFHQSTAKPKAIVRPPRSPEIQVGVWATRSPYRPNSLGLTLAQIDKVENGRLYLSEIDLLDQTPILDLKPYVTESDRPSRPRQGWIEEVKAWTYQLSPIARSQVKWLKTHGLSEIDDVLESQFGTPPMQPKRKRVKNSGDHLVLAYRTWRFIFDLIPGKTKSLIREIKSGYSIEELKSFEDPYLDKDLHRNFTAWVSGTSKLSKPNQKNHP